MWEVTIFFKKETPWGFCSFGEHAGDEAKAFDLANDIMEAKYVSCYNKNDHRCLYVKQEYVEAVGIRPLEKK